MYLIGLFSRINRITTKTLRHYDEIGLLKPENVDEETGYRYYTNEQLPRLHRILAYKQLGLTLDEIIQVIDDPSRIEVFLKIKTRELEESILTQSRQLREVRNLLTKLKGEHAMEYTVVIKTLPEVIIASMRTTVPSYNTFFDIVPKMGDEMRRQGAVCREPEYCFNIYHDGEYKESDIDVEVCQAVVKACPDSTMVRYKTIEGVPKAACILHKGPYSTLRTAYAFLFQWIEENGYTIADNPRESYIDGIWNKESEEEWLTELQVPVTEKE